MAYVNLTCLSHIIYQANNTGGNRKVGEAVSSFSFTPSDALIAAIEDVHFGSFKVKVRHTTYELHYY